MQPCHAQGCPSDRSDGSAREDGLEIEDGIECNCCHTLAANENESERLADGECTNDFEGTGSSGMMTNEACNGYPAGVYMSDGFALGGTCRVAIYTHPFRQVNTGGVGSGR